MTDMVEGISVVTDESSNLANASRLGTNAQPRTINLKIWNVNLKIWNGRRDLELTNADHEKDSR